MKNIVPALVTAVLALGCAASDAPDSVSSYVVVDEALDHHYAGVATPQDALVIHEFVNATLADERLGPVVLEIIEAEGMDESWTRAEIDAVMTRHGERFSGAAAVALDDALIAANGSLSHAPTSGMSVEVGVQRAPLIGAIYAIAGAVAVGGALGVGKCYHECTENPDGRWCRWMC